MHSPTKYPIAGTGTPGTRITISLPGTDKVLSTTVQADGTWSVTPAYEASQAQSEEILAFPIDIDAVLQHLHRDMRDDWFEDVLQHRDLLSNREALREVLHELLLGGNGRYSASKRHVYDIPKKGYGIRYSLETDFYDRFIYQTICTYLVPYFDPLLSHRVLGHRFNNRKAGKDLFKNRIDRWQVFEGVTQTAIYNNQALFATDLINYYENITVECIDRAFDGMLENVVASGPEKVLIRNSILTLCELLRHWGYSERHGLPQNRDASSFIANVVLNSVDHEMVRLGYDYYRYVDDIRIICESPRIARKAATTLIGLLRTVGMNINSSKTKILTSASSTSDIAEFFPNSDDRSVAIDSMWRSRSRKTILRSIKYIYQLLIECVGAKQTQSRQFRFAVNRLIRLVDAELFDVRGELATNLKVLLIQSLDEHGASTDQYCRLLGSLGLSTEEMEEVSDFLCDHQRSIHSWQNYHLWILLARHKYKTERLTELAAARIKSDLLHPDVAAVFIYLRCVDETKPLIALIQQFRSTWPFYHQRNYLLATSEFDGESLKPLISELGPKLRGTVARAKSHFVNGNPITEREPNPISIIYDDISPYD